MTTDHGRLSDAEAFMWTLEQDPMLSSNVATVSIIDGPVDFELLRNKMLHAVAAIPRLRQRIGPHHTRLTTPAWEADRDFEIDYHLRRMAVGGNGTERELLDLATRLLQDPMDRNRPLWMYILIDGLHDGRSAFFTKLHHTVTDGQGGVRMSQRYMEPDPAPADPGPIDLQPILDADADAGAESADGHDTSGVGDLTDLVRKGFDALRKVTGDAAVTMADPGRVPERGAEIVAGARQLAEQLTPKPGGSTLWRDRGTRRRRLDILTVEFRPAIDAARALGVSLNDLFMAAVVEAAARYHAAAGDESEEIVISFIVSTRTSGQSETSNNFTPTKLSVPLAASSPADRVRALHEQLGHRKSEVRGAGLLSNVASMANVLPASFLTRMARVQASGVDIATSNVRAAPFPVYVAGGKVEHTYPIGPVAGTAANITMVSYDGKLDIGIHTDPVAVTEPERLVEMLRESLGDLVAGAKGSARRR